MFFNAILNAEKNERKINLKEADVSACRLLIEQERDK
jgi:hypothetical protein